MIHYTCDRCQCVIDSSKRTRYVVHIDVQSVCEQPLEDDEAIDHLSVLNQVLEAESCEDTLLEKSHRGDGSLVDSIFEGEAVGSGSGEHAELDSASQQFDLCPDCYRKYRRNPLAREHSMSLQFSNN